MNKLAIALGAALFGAQVASAQALELSTQEQKLSYAVGVQLGHSLKKQNLKIDVDALSAAIKDVMDGGALKLTPEEMVATMEKARETLAAEQKAKADAAQEAGKKFLAENKGKAGITTLPSGLQYEELKAGTGETPAKGSEVTVHYEGRLINGTVFDSSLKRGEPVTFGLDGVIPGFSEALSLMKPGAKWRVFIPSELGYGAKGAGEAIGPNETLIFEIELLSVKGA